MYWHDAEWWAWIPMTVTMIAFWGLVAWIAIRLLLAPAGRDEPPPSAAPREILDARLAAGEIDRAEYDELRAVLDGERGEQTPSRSGEEVRS